MGQFILGLIVGLIVGESVAFALLFAGAIINDRKMEIKERRNNNGNSI